MTLKRVQVVLFAALLLATAAMMAPAAAPSTSQKRQWHSTLESGVFQQLNTVRVRHGLRPLRLSASLGAAAVQHTREMGADGYFEHASHDGTAFWKRIGRWYISGGYGSWAVGENLLWSSPDVTPEAALRIWMSSPEHRSNILTAKWREIGISAVHVDGAPGTYRGLPVTIITTDFGVRQ
jgi:uncharacterized protein YkwD